MTARRNVVKLDTGPVAFSIIGISSHENDYRLSWSINGHLNLSFAQGGSLPAGNGKEFTYFVHEDGEKTLMLISNRCDNGFLLEKYKNFDFILKFDAELNETEAASWLRNLRKVPLVSAAYQIPVNKQIVQILG